jgi:protein-L-isoaspartate(D-aspartate) O-methyltransferase
MVAQLRGFGISERTLTAFARVRRHRLVTRFWSLPAGIERRPNEAIEYREGDVRGLRLLHEIDRAVAVNSVSDVTGGTTSTASAPRLLAMQADLLALEPGMSVLEIGTGPGYFAAVLAELVGRTGRVVTIDIDGIVAARAAVRLEGLGYDNISVLVRDGHDGAVDMAPFDRVVGSVGCVDVSAAWLGQLRPDGHALVPLLHGLMHPIVLVDTLGRAHVVSRSGYVGIQGRQTHTSLWPHARAVVAPEDRVPLPATLAAALTHRPDANGFGSDAEWGLGYWLAAADQRAGHLAMLNDGAGSSARIDVAAGASTWGGPAGRELAAELGRHAEAWQAAGAPTLADYRQWFVPIDDPVPNARTEPSWTIPRIDHNQLVELAGRGTAQGW